VNLAEIREIGLQGGWEGVDLGAMKPLRPILAAALSLLLSPLSAAVTGKAIEYPVGEVLCEGWHAYDDSVAGKRPSILIVHQWTGLTDYEKMRAEMLAKLGYNVFALDIYGKGIRPQPPESGKEAGKYKENRALFRKRLEAGLQVLRGLPQTDPEKIAAIGYCFGGTGVLELARAGAKIDGIVSFHGGLGTPTPDDAKQISCEVLVLHGADDPFVPPAEVEGFHREMKATEVKYEFVAYPGAVHAFTQKMAGDDPSKGAAYQAEADAKSWEAMKAFFDRIFGS
jgi:dienelactone hydrolase